MLSETVTQWSLRHFPNVIWDSYPMLSETVIQYSMRQLPDALWDSCPMLSETAAQATHTQMNQRPSHVLIPTPISQRRLNYERQVKAVFMDSSWSRSQVLPISLDTNTSRPTDRHTHMQIYRDRHCMTLRIDTNTTLDRLTDIHTCRYTETVTAWHYVLTPTQL